MSRKEYMYWQNRNDRVSECICVRASDFGVFNSFTVKKVNFFTIMSNLRLSYLQKWGGGCLYRPSPPPPPKKVGGIHPPPPSPGIYASAINLVELYPSTHGKENIFISEYYIIMLTIFSKKFLSNLHVHTNSCKNERIEAMEFL